MTDNIDRQFDAIQMSFNDSIKDALTEVAESAANDLRSVTPVDSGTMRDSIETTRVEEDDGVFSIDVMYDASEFPEEYYAPFVETSDGERPMQEVIEEAEQVFLGELTKSSKSVLRKK